MPFGLRFPPELEDCCGCVTDLRTAAAIIAVLGIVSSPAVSWAVIRHTYVIRVSCVISSSLTRPDVVDVSLNNILSFGFGANAGLGPSCLSKNRTNTPPQPSPEDKIYFRAKQSGSSMVSAVRYVGWTVLVIDIAFVCCSIYLLIKLFNGPDRRAVKLFMITAMLSIVMSFIYCMLFVAACVSLGGAFPVIEFVFAFFDLFKWAIWIHFLLVMQSYSNSYNKMGDKGRHDESTIWGITSWIRQLFNRWWGVPTSPPRNTVPPPRKTIPPPRHRPTTSRRL